MRRIAILLVAILVLTNASAEARRNNRPVETTGSNIAAGCSPWATESLEINITTDDATYLVSIWGRGYKSFKAGVPSLMMDNVENENGVGRGMVCGTGAQTGACSTSPLRIEFRTADSRPGAALMGTITAGSESASFKGNMPSSPAQCK